MRGWTYPRERGNTGLQEMGFVSVYFYEISILTHNLQDTLMRESQLKVEAMAQEHLSEYHQKIRRNCGITLPTRASPCPGGCLTNTIPFTTSLTPQVVSVPLRLSLLSISASANSSLSLPPHTDIHSFAHRLFLIHPSRYCRSSSSIKTSHHHHGQPYPDRVPRHLEVRPILGLHHHL